jgi:maltooligosyltrehalose synthase
VNGLVQTLLKYTVPGVPDLYQGCEFWDLSLVDPDNRRPVDWATRASALEGSHRRPLAELASRWRDGRVKQALVARLLALRAAAPRLFAQGDYRPVSVEGPGADRLVAFERHLGERRVVVVACRHPGGLRVSDTPGVPGDAWRGMSLAHTGGAAPWRNVLDTGVADAASQPPGLPPLERLLSPLPFAVVANF